MENTENQTNMISYYVGDLCYVLGESSWDSVCSVLEDFVEDHLFSLPNGAQYVLFLTAYGDGQYNDLEGRPYAVDSGTLGAIAASDCDPERLAYALEFGLGHVHEFPAALDATDCSSEDGVLTFGSVVIDTANV